MKNIFRKVKNNVEYYKWMQIRKEALDKANEHMFDDDQTEFIFWMRRHTLACQKCNEIDID